MRRSCFGPFLIQLIVIASADSARAQSLGQVTVFDPTPSDSIRFDPPIEIASNLVAWDRPSGLVAIDVDRTGSSDSSLDIAVSSANGVWLLEATIDDEHHFVVNTAILPDAVSNAAAFSEPASAITSTSILSAPLGDDPGVAVLLSGPDVLHTYCINDDVAGSAGADPPEPVFAGCTGSFFPPSFAGARDIAFSPDTTYASGVFAIVGDDGAFLAFTVAGPVIVDVAARAHVSFPVAPERYRREALRSTA
jgi:hypothetical protein